MVVILINNSYSRIIRLDDKAFKALRKELSYTVDFAQAQYIPNPANRIKYCIDAKGNFGTGLLPRVKRFLAKHQVPFEVQDDTGLDRAFKRINRSYRSDFNLNPYPDQTEAVNCLLSHPRGVLSAPTGSGKSRIITMLLHQTRLKTLIIVPTLELKAQLTETLKEAFTSIAGITVLNVDSSKLAKETGYDMLIIDEAHHAAAQTYRDLNKRAWTNIPFRYAVSATPFRNAPEEQMLYESVVGEVVYTIAYSRAVEAGYIVPAECYYYELPKIAQEGYTYREVYSELVVEREDRNLLISDLIKSIQAADKAVLCLVKEIKHGKLLSELSGVPFVNGGEEETRSYIQDFNTGKIKALIGTTGVLGEGCDTKPCEYVIIASPGKARSAFMQQCGRAFRTFPGKNSAKIIIFKDKSSRFMLKHFQQQAKIVLDEYQIKIIKLEFE